MLAPSSPLRLVGRDVLFVHWPVPVSRPFVQVNLRTYVRFDGDPGVYFLSLDAGNRAAEIGRAHV